MQTLISPGSFPSPSRSEVSQESRSPLALAAVEPHEEDPEASEAVVAELPEDEVDPLDAAAREEASAAAVASAAAAVEVVSQEVDAVAVAASVVDVDVVATKRRIAVLVTISCVRDRQIVCLCRCISSDHDTYRYHDHSTAFGSLEGSFCQCRTCGAMSQVVRDGYKISFSIELHLNFKHCCSLDCLLWRADESWAWFLY